MYIVKLFCFIYLLIKPRGDLRIMLGVPFHEVGHDESAPGLGYPLFLERIKFFRIFSLFRLLSKFSIFFYSYRSRQMKCEVAVSSVCFVLPQGARIFWGLSRKRAAFLTSCFSLSFFDHIGENIIIGFIFVLSSFSILSIYIYSWITM